MISTLSDRQIEAIKQAEIYRAQHGDPITNLADLFAELDNNIWQAIIDKPYG